MKGQEYPHLQKLISIPTPEFTDHLKIYAASSIDRAKTVGAKYFPEWYYCPNCRRLKKFSVWKDNWNLDKKFLDNEPACFHCSKKTKRGVNRHKLQQVRFVMVDMLSGELKDIPFDKLWKHSPSDKTWQISESPTESDLYYRTSENNDGLFGIYITTEDQTKKIKLSQIHANYLIEPGDEFDPSKAYKMEMRGSQSLYLPNIVSSIFIPFNDPSQVAKSEDELDLQEFRYLIDDSKYNDNRLVGPNRDLVATRKNVDNLPKFIKRITTLERLKETSVLLSYNRLAKPNEQRQWYDVSQKKERNDMMPVSKKPFKKLNDLTWMPAVEAYGEGILFEMDLKEVSIEERCTFAHTFCHIVMKELEFQCGYPLTSLKEKIFIDSDNNRAGFLIYTIAGSEGSYGGLVSLTDDGSIIKLIDRGTKRAKHCTNDPICINEPDAHCFACLDLPETSCSKFNNDLNRKVFLKYFFPHEGAEESL